MFRIPERLSRPAARPSSRQLVNRALLFTAGLVLLWIALQLAPRSGPPPSATVETEIGAVAANPERPGLRPERTSWLSAGNLAALLLLVGGVAVALHLRRRAESGAARATAFFEPVGSYGLAPGQELRLVRCGDEVLLLGATNGGITLLKAYPPDAFPELTEETRGAAARGGVQALAPERPGAPFADLLRQYAGRYMNIDQLRQPS